MKKYELKTKMVIIDKEARNICIQEASIFFKFTKKSEVSILDIEEVIIADTDNIDYVRKNIPTHRYIPIDKWLTKNGITLTKTSKEKNPFNWNDVYIMDRPLDLWIITKSHKWSRQVRRSANFWVEWAKNNRKSNKE